MPGQHHEAGGRGGKGAGRIAEGEAGVRRVGVQALGGGEGAAEKAGIGGLGAGEIAGLQIHITKHGSNQSRPDEAGTKCPAFDQLGPKQVSLIKTGAFQVHMAKHGVMELSLGETHAPQIERRLFREAGKGPCPQIGPFQPKTRRCRGRIALGQSQQDIGEGPFAGLGPVKVTQQAQGG